MLTDCNKRPRRSGRLDKAARAAAEEERAAEAFRRESARAARHDAKKVLREGRRVQFDEVGRAHCPLGLARWRVDDETLRHLRGMHDAVKRSAPKPMSWAGGSDNADTRWRCFGLPPGARRRLKDNVAFHSFETPLCDQDAEIRASWASCSDLEPNDDEARALGTVALDAAKCLDERHASECTVGNLVAIQPNVHGGSEFLPRHLDWPRNDGFGVVIVTVAIAEPATVVLTADDGDFYFDLPQGYAYCLASDARNLYTHGLFCFGHGHRESLNLRFGLHSHDHAKRDIYTHWAELYHQDPANAACGPDGPVYD